MEREMQTDNPNAPDYDWQADREWFNQRLANARIHNSELERKLAVARSLLREARQWKRKGYPVMKQRIDEWLDSTDSGSVKS
jgi:hypothetical protein